MKDSQLYVVVPTIFGEDLLSTTAASLSLLHRADLSN